MEGGEPLLVPRRSAPRAPCCELFAPKCSRPTRGLASGEGAAANGEAEGEPQSATTWTSSANSESGRGRLCGSG